MQTPSRPLVCQGDAYEMGRAQGAALGGEILRAYEDLRKIEAFCLKRPWWLPFGAFRRIARKKAGRVSSPAVAAGSPGNYQRTLGIASGADAPVDGVWLLQAVEGLLGSVDGAVDVPPPGGCSALAIRGAASATGRPIIAHNFDYLPPVQPFFFIRESQPAHGLRSIEFTVAPLAGAIDGVNEKGLAITYDYSQTLATLDPGRAGPTISMRISETLAEAATVSEAVEKLSRDSRWGSGLLMLADATGDVASLELSNTRAEVRRPNDGADFVFHANNYVCPATAAVEVPARGVYNVRAPRPLRGRRVLDSSLRRMSRFDELLQDAAGLSSDDLKRIMSDHDGGEPSDATICMHSDYWITSACVQCLPQERTLRVAFGTACQAKYTDYTL